MNLNDLAREIVLAEGKKHPLGIGDVKEVMRIVFQRLAVMSNGQLENILRRYRPKEKKR